MNKLFIYFFLLFFSNTLLFANPNILARTAILIDYHSDKVLYELEPDAQIYPASMTKIMTAIVAIDLIQKNKYHLMINLQSQKMLGDFLRQDIHQCLS